MFNLVTLHFPVLNVMRFLLVHFSSLLRMAAQHSDVPSAPPSSDDTRKLAEGTLCLITQIINEDVKLDWIQYWPLVYTTHYWAPHRSLIITLWAQLFIFSNIAELKSPVESTLLLHLCTIAKCFFCICSE